MFPRVTLITAAEGALAASSALAWCPPPQPHANPNRASSTKHDGVFIRLIQSPLGIACTESSLTFLPLLTESADLGAKFRDREICGTGQLDDPILLFAHFPRDAGKLLRDFPR